MARSARFRIDALSSVIATATIAIACASARSAATTSSIEQCPEFRAPSKSLQISVQQTDSSRPNRARPQAQVITAFDGRPIGRAVLSASRSSLDTTHTDSSGRAFLSASVIRTGVLVTQAVGYIRRRDSLPLPLSPGARLTVPLDAQGLDGPCSGFAVPVTPRPP